MQFIYLYALSVPIFFVIDMLWLGFVARNLYTQQIGHLLGPVNWIAAISFYLIFLVGLVYFAIQPGMAGPLLRAIMLGALFGFFTYATYDLTNLATLKDWPLFITFVDMAWGTFLGGAVAGLTVFIARMFL